MRVRINTDDLRRMGDNLDKLLLDVPAIMTELTGQQADMANGYIKDVTPVITTLLRESWHTSPPVRDGDTYKSTISNNVEYAAYVEYGHRQTPGRYVPAIGKRLVRGYAPGKFMVRHGMRFYMQEQVKSINNFIAQKVQKYIQG